MAEESAAWKWEDVVARLREEPIDTVVQIAVSAIDEPTSVGLQPMPAGADGRPVFGAILDEQFGILVQVCGDNYEIRLCRLPKPAALAPVLSPQAVSSPQSALPAARPSTDLSPRAAPSAVAPRSNASPALIPELVESRAELVVRRRNEQRSLASLPAEQPGATMLMTTLFGTLLGAALGGEKGALAGALIGGGAGLASIAVSTAATSPATSMAAQSMFLALASASLGGRGGGPVLRLGPAGKPALPQRGDDDGPRGPRRLPPRRK